MAGQRPGRIAKRLTCQEIRGVGDDEIVGRGLIVLNRTLDDADPGGPGGGRHVRSGLGDCILIQLHPVDVTVGMAALGQHQRDEAAAAAYVQHPTRRGDGRPGSQQYAVGADFHGAAIVIDVKLFEGKTAVSSHLTPAISLPYPKWSAIIAAKP
ncbi:hypothetical protein D3C78_1549080 [compost metagenome]